MDHAGLPAAMSWPVLRSGRGISAKARATPEGRPEPEGQADSQEDAKMECEAEPGSGPRRELQSGAQSADDVPLGPAPEPQAAGDKGSQPMSSPQTSAGAEVKEEPQP